MRTLFDLLDDEWGRLSPSPLATSALRRWALCEPELAAFTDLDHLARWNRAATAAESDRLLAQLVGLGADALAPRTVLQLLLPGCRRVARQLRAGIPDADERAAVVVACAYNRIATYPLDRRPRSIAANVLLDAAKAARASVGRPADAAVALPGETAHTEAAGEELLAVLADAVTSGWINRDAATVIALTRIADAPVEDVAARLGCHPGSVRRRRRAAELALAERAA